MSGDGRPCDFGGSRVSEDASAPPLRRDVRTARSAVPAAGAPAARAGRLIAGFAAIALIGAGALVAGLAMPDPEVRESRPVEKHDLTVASIGGEGVGGIVRPVDRDDPDPTVPPVAPAEPQPQPQPQPPSSPVVTEEQSPSPPPAPAPSPEPSHPGGNGDRGRGPGERGRADPPPHAKPGSVLAFVERTAGYAVDLLGIDLLSGDELSLSR